MKVCKRKLITIAMAAALVSPVAFSHSPQAGSTAGNATSTSVRTGDRPAVPTLPTQSDTRATDAVSNKTIDTTTTSTSTTHDSMRDEAKSPPGKGNWWSDADTDGDGKISTFEATANAGLNSSFSKIDSNKDGFVTSDEYRIFYAQTASQGEQHAAANSAVVTRDLWSQLDANADGKISVAEAVANASVTGSFNAMDLDSDGFITQAEYTAYAKMH